MAAPTIERPTVDSALPLNGSSRLPAVAGLIFVGLAVLQNILRAVIAPSNDARSASIVSHYTDHRSALLLLTAIVVVGVFTLALFIGGLWTRLAQGEGRNWAQTGIIGVAGVFAIFPLHVACEIALLVVTHRSSVGVDTVETLWAFHNAVFVVNLAALGVATLALSLAGVRVGLLPRLFQVIGPIGGALLAAGALAGPQIAAGGGKTLFGLSGIGYVIWLSVVTASSAQLIRTTS